MTSLALSLFAALAASSPTPSTPGAMPMSVGSGVITGGWGYVWTAYGIFWVGLSLYAISLIVRTRAANAAQADKEQA
jgi:hypothetical protein